MLKEEARPSLPLSRSCPGRKAGPLTCHSEPRPPVPSPTHCSARTPRVSALRVLPSLDSSLLARDRELLMSVPTVHARTRGAPSPRGSLPSPEAPVFASLRPGSLLAPGWADCPPHLAHIKAQGRGWEPRPFLGRRLMGDQAPSFSSPQPPAFFSGRLGVPGAGLLESRWRDRPVPGGAGRGWAGARQARPVRHAHAARPFA